MTNPETSPWGSGREMQTIDVSHDPFMSHIRPHAYDVFVSNDPFMTHKSPAGRGTVDTSPPARAMEDVNADPFLTHSPAAQLLSRQQQKQGQDISKKTKAQRWARLPKFTAREGIMIMLPWFTFVVVLLLFLVVQHYSYAACMLLTFSLGVASLLCCFVSRSNGSIQVGASTIRIPFLGALCLLAVLLGVLVGRFGWHHHWRQLWWTQTGFRSTASSDTPAQSRSDSGVLDFWDYERDKTINGTRVGVTLSAGYKRGSMFCAAPVLSPFTLAGGIARVNYWVVGIDCCEPLGSFTCDYSRDASAGVGVVLLDGGMPCPGCNAAEFEAAIAKAEAVHGIVGGRNNLKLRWVRTTSDVTFSWAFHATLYLILWCLVAFAILNFLSYYILYLGRWRVAEEWFRGSSSRELDDLVEEADGDTQMPGLSQAPGRGIPRFTRTGGYDAAGQKGGFEWMT